MKRLTIHTRKNTILKNIPLTGLFYLSIVFSLISFQTNANPTTPPTTPHFKRVISLSPGTTELVASAGGISKLVGVVNYSDYPPAVKKLPLIGSYNAINFEKIINLKPDLIIIWQSGNRLQDIKRLQQLSQPLGFKLFYSNPKKISDIPKEIKALGNLLNTENLANQEAKQLENLLKKIQTTYQHTPKVRYFYEIWNQPLMTINGKQFISQGLGLCGGQNIYADLKPLAGEVSMESIIQRNPDIILLGGEAPLQNDWVKNWQKWPFINAVKNHHILKMNADQLQRPTARFIKALPKVCQALNQTRQSN